MRALNTSIQSVTSALSSMESISNESFSVDAISFTASMLKQLGRHLSFLSDAFYKFVHNPSLLELAEMDERVSDFCTHEVIEVSGALHSHQVALMVSTQLLSDRERGAEISASDSQMAEGVIEILQELNKYISKFKELKRSSMYFCLVENGASNLSDATDADDSLYVADTVLSREINNTKRYCQEILA